jgi:Flp pilus assembly protein TadB
MARRAALRASDAEREEIAERLRRATAEGRLLAEELEERLATALRARTQGELDVLVADLPAPRGGRRRGSLPMPRTVPEFALAIVLAMIGVMVLIGLALLVAGVFMLGGFWIVIAFFAFGRGRGPWGGQRSLPGARPPYGRGYYTRRSVYGPRRL